MRLAVEGLPRSEAFRTQGTLGLLLALGPWSARLLGGSGGSPGGLARNIFPPCLVHELTGLPCPTCGLTRSFVAMARGQVARSVHFHPLGPELFVGACLTGTILIATAVLARRWRLSFTAREESAALAGLAGALTLFWVARLMGGF